MNDAGRGGTTGTPGTGPRATTVRVTLAAAWVAVLAPACRGEAVVQTGGRSGIDARSAPVVADGPAVAEAQTVAAGHGGAVMGTFDDLLARRRSIRRFLADPVPGAAIDDVLRAATSGPSAGNLQAFRLVVVTDPAARRLLQDAALGQSSVGQAPVVIACCADGPESAAKYGARGSGLYAVQDATVACTLAWLKAVDLGLAGVWVGAFDEARVASVLGVPQGVRPVALLPLGYAAETPGGKTSRPRGDLVIER
jgi:nitroreductase